MISKKLKEMTYNDYAALSLGEAQALKRMIDAELKRLEDTIADLKAKANE